MISAGDIRNGITFEMDGKVMQVIEFQHVKPGKGGLSLHLFTLFSISFSNILQFSE